MTHDEIAELLGAYALDAVEPDEAVIVAAHLRECPRCSAELAEHMEVAGMLGDLGGDAPKELWESIASQATRPLSPTSLPADPPRRDRRHRPQRSRAQRSRHALRGAVAAVVTLAAVAIVLLSVQVVHLNTKVDALAKGRGIPAAVEQALLDPSATRVALNATAGGHAMLAELVLVPSGNSFLVDSDLTSLPRSQTYQLWAVTSGRPISLGLLGASPGEVPFVVNSLHRLTTYAITVEPSSGSRAPTGLPVAEGA